MGYTHYWKPSPSQSLDSETWAKLVEDAEKIVDATDVKICGPDGNDDTLPEFDIENGINLNGCEGNAHDSLELKKELKDFNFCKTARKPYDAVVTCILLRAHNLAPNTYGLSSDGSWDEWQPGRDLYSKIWPTETIRGFYGVGDPSKQESILDENISKQDAKADSVSGTAEGWGDSDGWGN